MGKYQDLTKNIPWWSFGRETSASRIGRSLVPVGVFPRDPPPIPPEEASTFSLTDPSNEDYLMNIIGTAIQGGPGKLVTCGHVVEALVKTQKRGYILSRIFRENTVICTPFRITYYHAIKYVDPRTDALNPIVDLAALIIPAKSTKERPYEAPSVKWGDSTKLGVGDQVVVGGYPYGKEMFLWTKSNRGILQPTFYSGIVSAILPATAPQEIRVIQASIPVAGGMSGGALFDPKTGKVIGMVTSGVKIRDIPQPMTYAIPSEIIAPFVEVITFKTDS